VVVLVRFGLVALAAAAAICVALPSIAEPAAHPVAQDGPFGIAMGEPIADLGPITALPVAGLYEVLRPPETSPDLTSVAVVAFASTGVCEVAAESEPHPNDPMARLAKSEVDAVAAALVSKYGPGAKVEACSDGDGDGTCATALARKLSQRAARYGYVWDFSAHPRPDHVWKIAVMAAADDDKTKVTVGLFNDRRQACDAADKAAGGSGL
jgi:hypothetical protein